MEVKLWHDVVGGRVVVDCVKSQEMTVEGTDARRIHKMSTVSNSLLVVMNQFDLKNEVIG